MKRMVYVNETEIISTTIASGILVGDVHDIRPEATILAMQIEAPDYLSDRYPFTDFPIFSLPSLIPLSPVNVDSYTYHNLPVTVDTIRITGLSTSAVCQIGGTDHVSSESRTKHIRLYKDERSP